MVDRKCIWIMTFHITILTTAIAHYRHWLKRKERERPEMPVPVVVKPLLFSSSGDFKLQRWHRPCPPAGVSHRACFESSRVHGARSPANEPVLLAA